jgi:putative transposase
MSVDFAAHRFMPRQARIYFPGLSVHIIQRGVGGATIFGDDDDHEKFLKIARAEWVGASVAVHAFALMKTHFHFLVTPPSKHALPQAMRRIGSKYVARFNKKYARFGSLWAGRYRGFAIGDERYWINCLRYIDLNPLTANVVSTPGDSRWSTYRVHAEGEFLDWITPHPIYVGLGSHDTTRQAAYRAICYQPDDPEFVAQQPVLREDTPMCLPPRPTAA